ncbi:interferon-inducible GTPase 5-like [Protopterus annectens]|uniref:interferon-inducible GTPase 5-like n=1 Tax=Protopterus annectens TaxID=7888 RepID=UPI001CFAA2E0|nr:interferon-inducible GTPase 5-like [Protopterus annectens]
MASSVPAINEKMVKELNPVFQTSGTTGVINHLEKKLKCFQNTAVDIAVTGESGTGKSSLINALLAVLDTDQSAAPVDVKETTLRPVAYKHKKFPNVVFWDLPGIGTLNFPACDYLERLGILRFDFFLICGIRFTENDAALAKVILIAGKKFFFVRMKVDTDIEYYKRLGRQEETALEVIQKDCADKLEAVGMHSSGLFLVSSWFPHKYDFARLYETLQNELPKVKRQAFLLTLSNIACSIIEIKVRYLKRRVWRAALLSCLGSAVPLPLVSVICNAKILAREVDFYYQQLGLDDDSLSYLASRYQKPLYSLKGELHHRYMVTEDDLVERMASVAGEKRVVAYTVLSCLPFLGSVPSVALSFEIVSRMLHQLLDELEEDSKRVLKSAVS